MARTDVQNTIEDSERGPGRPEVGAPINVRLGDELLAQVDALATERGTSRAEMLRRLVVTALNADKPFMVQDYDPQTMAWDPGPRFASLTEALEHRDELMGGRSDYERTMYRYRVVDQSGRVLEYQED